MDSLGDLFNAAIGGGISGSGVAVLARLWFGSVIERNKQLSKQNDELAKALEELKTKDVAELKKDFTEHVKGDRSLEIVTEIKHVSGMVSKMNDKLDRQSEITAAHASKFEAQALYLANLDKSFESHKNQSHNSGRN